MIAGWCKKHRGCLIVKDPQTSEWHHIAASDCPKHWLPRRKQEMGPAATVKIGARVGVRSSTYGDLNVGGTLGPEGRSPYPLRGEVAFPGYLNVGANAWGGLRSASLPGGSYGLIPAYIRIEQTNSGVVPRRGVDSASAAILAHKGNGPPFGRPLQGTSSSWHQNQ